MPRPVLACPPAVREVPWGVAVPDSELKEFRCYKLFSPRGGPVSEHCILLGPAV